MPARLRRGDPEAVQQISRVTRLPRRLVGMKATEVSREHVQRRVVDVGNEGDGTSARPARDHEPGSGHPKRPIAASSVSRIAGRRG